MRKISRPVHGLSVGVITLDTRFQRLVGDVGNASTFDFPVQYAILESMSEGSSMEADTANIQKFVDVAEKLINVGVSGITTSCGFFSIFQAALTECLPVPVATSSLLQIPLVQRLLPKGQRVGVITATPQRLTTAHFRAVGAPEDTPFEGLEPEGTFRRNLRNGVDPVSFDDHWNDMQRAMDTLLSKHSSIGAIVLECTNMPPYSAQISAKYNLPVYDAVSMIKWFHAGLRPHDYRRG